MNTTVTALPLLLAALFATLGAAKILALGKMRELAEKDGFSVTGFRLIGALEVAGALGLIAGPAVPPVGVAALCGLLLLLGGAATVHLRRGHKLGNSLRHCCAQRSREPLSSC
ncbi:DoxX family protein [Streptomyces microflavus]|uniref:DoxX family protein n=1 Tax=Streptomyces microflavus TaxID=1919 RepID=UPI003447C142